MKNVLCDATIRIGVYASRCIQAGEELFFDYGSVYLCSDWLIWLTLYSYNDEYMEKSDFVEKDGTRCVKRAIDSSNGECRDEGLEEISRNADGRALGSTLPSRNNSLESNAEGDDMVVAQDSDMIMDDAQQSDEDYVLERSESSCISEDLEASKSTDETNPSKKRRLESTERRSSQREKR